MFETDHISADYLRNSSLTALVIMCIRCCFCSFLSHGDMADWPGSLTHPNMAIMSHCWFRGDGNGAGGQDKGALVVIIDTVNINTFASIRIIRAA